MNPSVGSNSGRKPTRTDYVWFLVGTVSIAATYVIFAVCAKCLTAIAVPHIGVCVLASSAAVYGVLKVAARTVNRRLSRSKRQD